MERFDNIDAFGIPEEALRRIQEKYVRFFRSGGKVLDIGCGRGVFLEILARHGFQPYGLDIAADRVECSRQRAQCEVVCAGALPYLSDKTEFFDGIIASHVIEHMVASETESLIQKAHAALKPGGVLVLVTPNSTSRHVITEAFWLDTTHVRPYPLQLLQKMMGSTGFQVVSSGEDDGTRGRQTPVDALVRRFRRLFIGRTLDEFEHGAGAVYIVGRKQ
jgi:cyclopropane fatty-acyl-phospholipid synthase-like methyltransferase